MKSLTDKDIENYLNQIEGGERSEDDLDVSDVEDFCSSRQELHNDLENPVDDENDYCDDDLSLIEDPPATSESHQVPQVPFPSTTQASRRATMKGLVWKVKKLILNPDQITFRGNTTYPAELRDQAAGGTPYTFFSYIFTSQILQKIVEESNLYAVQTNVQKPLNLSEAELRKFISVLIYMSVIKYPNVRLYWSNKVGFEPIKKIMTINRFETIKISSLQ
ncbi:hypothetical protein EVAR_55197_1 [Eumeta japonica]|uniref:PiggyBac transposable element-derived protein domain-containing protein n=1 Tax=Eumeta variegata TaxID=151549 RepID=A0A4C1ZA28_EUMVA|nr:hypothetical protein EVAR_55197_1 [Eumeta japonica]